MGAKRLFDSFAVNPVAKDAFVALRYSCWAIPRESLGSQLVRHGAGSACAERALVESEEAERRASDNRRERVRSVVSDGGERPSSSGGRVPPARCLPWRPIEEEVRPSSAAGRTRAQKLVGMAATFPLPGPFGNAQGTRATLPGTTIDAFATQRPAQASKRLTL